MSILRLGKRIPLAEAEALRDYYLQMFLSGPTSFSRKALAQRSWLGVPVDNRISLFRARFIARAARHNGAHNGLAMTTEPEIHAEIFRFPLSRNGIRAFDANCMLRAIPSNEQFAILQQGDFYYVLAGSRSLLELALGKSLGQARKLFEKYAARPQWGEDIRKWLIGVHEYYADDVPSE